MFWRSSLLAILVAATACSRADNSRSHVPRIPRFEAVSSEGTRISSDSYAGSPLVVVFFDTQSVLAWRKLGELEKTGQQGTNLSIAYLGIGGEKSPSTQVDVDQIKRECAISFPVVMTGSSELTKVFGAPDCCDYVLVFDEKGYLRASKRLSALGRLGADFIVSSLTDSKISNRGTSETSQLYEELGIRGKDGAAQPIPLAAEGLTLVNVFNEFCTECATGARLETLNRPASKKGDSSRIRVIFSEADFSEQDVENFRAVLGARCPMFRGNIGAASNLTIGGRLLIAFDTQGRAVWQEKSVMTEDEITSEISRLIQ